MQDFANCKNCSNFIVRSPAEYNELNTNFFPFSNENKWFTEISEK